MKPAMTESSLSIRKGRGVRLSSLLRGLGLLWVSLMLM